MPALQSLALPFSFVRLQSSLCEAQAMEKLCLELDANLLVVRPRARARALHARVR